MAYQNPRDHSRVRDDRGTDSRLMESRAAESTEEDLFDPMKSIPGPFPDLPELPGWHFKWVHFLDDNGKEDPRTVMREMHPITGGYEMVRPEEVAPIASMKIGAGTYSGFIGMQGNVLLKIRHSRWLKLHEAANKRAFNQVAEIYQARPQVQGGDDRAPVSAKFRSTLPVPTGGRVPSDPNI